MGERFPKIRCVDTRDGRKDYAPKEDLDYGMFADEMRWNEEARSEIERELQQIHDAAVRRVKEAKDAEAYRG